MEAFFLNINLQELRNNNSSQGRRVNSILNGTESVSYLALKIWALVPSEIKQPETLNAFKLESTSAPWQMSM